MARQDINIEFNTFVGGILTEANPINYPKGFTLDEENFILLRDGTRRRRRGLKYIDSNTDTGFINLGSTSTTEDFFKGARTLGTSKLLTTAGSGIYATIACFWSNDLLEFYDITDDTKTAADRITSRTAPAGQDWVDVVAIRDVILATTSTGDIEVFTVTSTAITFTQTLRLTVRDFAGFNVDYDTLDTRPVTLTENHRYNLYNQGWSNTNILAFNTAFSKHPSLSDNMNSGLDGDTGVFTASWVDLANNGFAKVSGGRAIIDPFTPEAGRDTLYNSEFGSNPTLQLGTAIDGYIRSMEVHAGRVFYLCSSENADIGATFLAFSSIDNRTANLSRCYQKNDPTSRDTSFLLDTDGGVLDISSVGNPIRIVSLKDKLVVFGTRGVFELSSRDGFFSPASLELIKITDIPVSNMLRDTSGVVSDYIELVLGDCICTGEEVVYYLSNSGVIALDYNSDSKQFKSTNLTESSIQTLINKIPNKNKAVAQCIYVPSDKTFRMMFTNRFLAGDSKHAYFAKDQELVYDTVLKAWYKNRFSTSTSNNQAQPDGFGTEALVPTFYLLMDFTTDVPGTYPVDPALTYVSPGNLNRIAWARQTDTTFKNLEGDDAAAFMQTGFINAGDSQRRKQANYIIPSFLRTEDGFTDDGGGDLTPTNESSCTIRADWDYADTDAGNLFGTPFEAYRFNRLFIPSGPSDPFDYGQSVITTKNKLLGRGRALSLRFSTTALKDCQLLGWGLGFETETKV